MRCVPARDFTVDKALVWRGSIDAEVPYQRESFVWSLEQQQLFIDSLLNGYDVPKFYLHDLRGVHPTRVYAIVDGKQRLTTLWRFLGDEVPLATDFRAIEANLPDLSSGTRHPRGGDRFSDLDPAWQGVVRGTHLSVVLIQNATPEDIEDLFSRLNNGEPLNAAEHRNALGGAMAELIRSLSRHPLCADRLPVGNGRLQHFDLAAKVLRLAKSELDGETSIPDLRAAALDAFVRRGRHMGLEDRGRLETSASAMLDRVCGMFHDHDPLLRFPDLVPLLILYLKDRGTDDPMPTRSAIETFESGRRSNLERPPAQRDPGLVELTLLSQSGSPDSQSLARRLAIFRDAMAPFSARRR